MAGSFGSSQHSTPPTPFGIAGPNKKGATGSQGPQGVPGQSASVWPFKADANSTAGNPAAGFMQWNNATQASATTLYLNVLDSDGSDITVFVPTLVSGQELLVQDQNASANFQKWTVGTVSGPVAGVFTITVTLASSGCTGTTNFPNNHQLIGVAVRTGPPFQQGISAVSVINGGTVTLAPAVGTDVVITPPSTGGAFTINAGTVTARQRILIDIKNGSTACTVTLGTGIISGTTSPTYTGGVANTTDNLSFIATGTVTGAASSTLRFEAANLGFTS